MAFLELEGITKYFGQVTAVDHINLSVERGEFLTLLGPSGCGKTTILRMVAGFESPNEGTILLDGDNITNRPASKRPMGMVFQSYALFPHLTAAQNIAFGMSIRRQSKDVIKQRCAELLKLVGLGEMGNRYPHQLSGGQQQRIALARALAVEPKVLLLDEPLSALDAKVRITLRNEIRRIQQQLKMTAIYVTHDQEEALAISDRIAVMAQGNIEQLDQPEEIYSNPHTVFAATFVGTSNQFNSIVQSASDGLCQVGDRILHVTPLSNMHDGDHALVIIRPEEVSIQPKNEPGNDSTNLVGNAIAGVIELRTFLGPFTRFHIRITESALSRDGTGVEEKGDTSVAPGERSTNERATMTADVPNQLAGNYYVAQNVILSFPPSACQVLPLNAREVELKRLAQAEKV